MHSVERKENHVADKVSPAALHGVKLQTKLSIGAVNDPLEHEADAMADKVMSMQQVPPATNTASTAIQRKCAECEEDEEKKVQRKPLASFIQRKESPGGAVASDTISNQIKASKGSGSSMNGHTQTFMQSRFGTDFTDVKIHTGNDAIQMNRELNAKAFTVGNDIYFNEGQYNPNSKDGKHLLAHELTHTVQQGSKNLQKKIQRAIHPEDVSSEMVGMQMTVTVDLQSGTGSSMVRIPANSLVTVVAWNNASDTVTISFAGGNFTVSKLLLRPVASSSGLQQYHSGIGSVVTSIATGESRIAQEQARRGGPRPGEIPRLQALQQNRMRLLNRRLIQEMMFNRFDPIIVTWTNHYNTQFAAQRFGNLDPNLVKSMLFQESQLGTSGVHLEVPPSHPVKTRFNLGQVIDSSASALLIMMREMEPALIATYHLQTIDADLAAAQRVNRSLDAQTFLWGYVATGQTVGFNDAVTDFFQTTSGQLNESYEFWIRSAIRWLFEKRHHVRTWEEAVRAYNGGGASARRYRTQVVGRTGQGTNITPPNI